MGCLCSNQPESPKLKATRIGAGAKAPTVDPECQRPTGVGSTHNRLGPRQVPQTLTNAHNSPLPGGGAELCG